MWARARDVISSVKDPAITWPIHKTDNRLFHFGSRGTAIEPVKEQAALVVLLITRTARRTPKSGSTQDPIRQNKLARRIQKKKFSCLLSSSRGL